jgi:hypothetical protein
VSDDHLDFWQATLLAQEGHQPMHGTLAQWDHVRQNAHDLARIAQ